MGVVEWLYSAKTELKEEHTPLKRSVDFSDFRRVTDFIYIESGITDLDKRALTASHLKSYAQEQGIYTTDEFLEKMREKGEFYQEVMNIATVNESFFLREKKELEWLVSYVKRSESVLDILVLPCSTGEEVYSIILLLLEENISLDKINISGFDLSLEAIMSAKRAEYDEHSIHKIEYSIREKYFTKNERALYTLLPPLKDKANFYQANIFEIDSSTKSYDIVLSRNMFIYFDDENRERALDIIVSILKPNGIYIKGHADYIKKHPSLVNITHGIYSKQI